MVRGPEVPLWKRHVIIAYHELDGRGQSEIARALNLGKKTVDLIIKRTKSRCQSTNIDDLMQAVTIQPRSGRLKRAAPGSDLSLAVRQAVQDYENQLIEEAANHSIH